ncbi:hypothetical protein [Achromobacter sp. 2789STDY5608615]|uniref:hypothetical protein n=1 Tax=Achromobacter sp. 2789STDY5608615 TaxID=1806492 RepID=UPI0012E15521|nr:hypothetical protein [Achromobacter sp. 2789STDY5608615]
MTFADRTRKIGPILSLVISARRNPAGMPDGVFLLIGNFLGKPENEINPCRQRLSNLGGKLGILLHLFDEIVRDGLHKFQWIIRGFGQHTQKRREYNTVGNRISYQLILN